MVNTTIYFPDNGGNNHHHKRVEGSHTFHKFKLLIVLYSRVSRQTIEFESLFVGDLDLRKSPSSICDIDSLEGMRLSICY
jgi:hypothetical protein